MTRHQNITVALPNDIDLQVGEVFGTGYTVKIVAVERSVEVQPTRYEYVIVLTIDESRYGFEQQLSASSLRDDIEEHLPNLFSEVESRHPEVTVRRNVK